MEKAHEAALEGLKKSIAEMEARLKQIIREDEGIRKKYQLLLSVPGVGHLTVLHIIKSTNNFAVKISGKQLGSYAGVVPF